MYTCTPEQLHMMSHAVGHLKRSDRPRAHASKLSQCYRNYYCSEQCAAWDDLVAHGLAVRKEGNVSTGGDCVYSITETGFAVLVGHRASLLAAVKSATARLKEFS